MQFSDLDGGHLILDFMLPALIVLCSIYLLHSCLEQDKLIYMKQPMRTWVVGIVLGVVALVLLTVRQGLHHPMEMSMLGIVYMLGIYFGRAGSAVIIFMMLLIFRMMDPASYAMNWQYWTAELVYIAGLCLLNAFLKSFFVQWLSGGLFLLLNCMLLGLFQGFAAGWMCRILSLALMLLMVIILLSVLARSRERQQRLMQSYRQLEELVEHQPGFTFIVEKRNGRYEYLFSEGEMLQLIGVPPHRQGQPMGSAGLDSEIFPQEIIDFIHQKYQEAWEGKPVYYEVECLGHYALVKLQPIVDEHGRVQRLIGYGVNIATYKSVRRQLQEQGEGFAFLKEYAEDWIMEFTADGRIMYANSNALQALQLELPQIMNQHLEKLVHIEQEEQWVRLMRSTQHNEGTKQTELRIILDNGMSSYYNVYILPFYHRDVLVRIQAVFQNITDAREREAAVEASAAKSEFLTYMTHEIRTILNGLIGFLLLLQRTRLSPIQQDYVRKMNDSSHSLMNVTNDILDMAKIEAGKLVLEQVPFHFEKWIKGLADKTSVYPRQQNVELVFYTDPDCPLYVVGDPYRLEQVLLNLLSNAVKFTDAGHVLLRTEVISLEAEQVRILFEIEDTGIGMTKEQMSRVFMSFTQGDPDISRKYGGTGLGLFICKHLVESMGGSLEVDSAFGSYSRFYFELSFALAASQEQALPDHTEVSIPNYETAIVDHPSHSRESMTQILQSFGMNPRVFSSFKEFISSGWGTSNDQGGQHVLIMNVAACAEDPLERRIMELTRLLRPYLHIVVCSDAGNVIVAEAHDYEVETDARLFKPVTRLGLLEVFEMLEEPALTSEGSTEQDMSEPASLIEKKCILVGEDERISQLVIEGLLGYLGYEVTIASNGYEVLDWLEKKPWSLIFLDLSMPKLGGMETALHIRRIRAYDQTPIIAITANSVKSVHEQCLSSGINEVLMKPVHSERLMRIVDAWSGMNGLRRIQGVDIEQALTQMDEKMHILQFALRRFKTEYEPFGSIVQQELHDKNFDQVSRRIHTLKGAAANLYARRLQQKVIEMEELLQHGALEHEIELTLEEVLHELQLILQSMP